MGNHLAELMGVIYSLRFAGSSNRYVGSTKNIKNRESAHRSLLRKGTHPCRALQNAVLKYGLENMIIEILQEGIRIEWLIQSEQHWLNYFDGNLYNRLKVAAPRPQAIITDETRALIRAKLIGNQYRKGIPHSPEVRAKISAAGKLAYKEGRREYLKLGKNIHAYWAKVDRNEIPHPTRRTHEFIREVLVFLHETGSTSKTASHFGMTTANINIIVKNAMANLQEWSRCALGRDGFADPPKFQRNKRIHPDWFEFVGGQ